MPTNLWFWIIFNAGVLSVLAIDLCAFHQKAHRPSVKEAAVRTSVWLMLSLGFSSLVWLFMGPGKAVEFLTGYLVEYSLSVDNIFVFVLIFSYFAVPSAYQYRVLFWGVLSALVLRGVMIGAGVAFIQTFHWALYFFGAFLLFTGTRLLFNRKKAVDIAGNPVIRLVRSRVSVSDHYHGAHFSIRRDGRRILTPLAMVLIMVEITDALFAVDSIPAIFGISHDPFIIFTSNVCAVLGLRSLYFLVDGVVSRFVYLKPALAIILCFIGTKMFLADLLHIPTAAALGFIGLVLLTAATLSLLVKQHQPSIQPASEDHSEAVIRTP
jgi:tellurite resistance protein TerC